MSIWDTPVSELKISIIWIQPIFLLGMVAGVASAVAVTKWADGLVKKVLDTPIKETRR